MAWGQNISQQRFPNKAEFHLHNRFGKLAIPHSFGFSNLLTYTSTASASVLSSSPIITLFILPWCHLNRLSQPALHSKIPWPGELHAFLQHVEYPLLTQEHPQGTPSLSPEYIYQLYIASSRFVREGVSMVAATASWTRATGWTELLNLQFTYQITLEIGSGNSTPNLKANKLEKNLYPFGFQH